MKSNRQDKRDIGAGSDFHEYSTFDLLNSVSKYVRLPKVE